MLMVLPQQPKAALEQVHVSAQMRRKEPVRAVGDLLAWLGWASAAAWMLASSEASEPRLQ